MHHYQIDTPKAISQAEQGLRDANLGRGVIKQHRYSATFQSFRSVRVECLNQQYAAK